MSAVRDWGVFRIHVGDCRDVLAAMPDASVDSIVTDPPYELTAGKRGGTGTASMNVNSPAGRARIGTGGFMGQQWDATGIAHNVEMWAECLRVLKPGGHLLAFGGTRTFHRLACAIEDAGFELRDSVLNLHGGGDCPWLAAWGFGSGFPKSLDVSKALQASDLWRGWGTALKPAFEPIVMARKPLVGTVAANVLAHGTGGLNIDACRVPTSDDLNGGRYSDNKRGDDGNTYGSGIHQLTVDTDGSGAKDGNEASRLFLVADGTASSSDTGPTKATTGTPN